MLGYWQHYSVPSLSCPGVLAHDTNGYLDDSVGQKSFFLSHGHVNFKSLLKNVSSRVGECDRFYKQFLS